MAILRPAGLGYRHQDLPVDAGAARLVEGRDGNVEAGVLPDDLVCVLVRVEAVHEDQGDVGGVLFVEELDLLNCQVQESQVGPHRDHRLWTADNDHDQTFILESKFMFTAPASHRGSQTSVELDDHQLVQHRPDGGAGLWQPQLRVGGYLRYSS